MGQSIIWGLYFFILAVKLDQEGKPIRSGLFLFLTALRIHLIIPMALYFLIYKRSWKNLVVAFTLHSVIHLFIAIYLGKSFLDLILVPFENSEQIGLVTAGYLDYFAFWGRITTLAGWVPIFISGLTACGLIFILAREKNNDDLGILALTAMVSSVLMYHRSYDYLVIVFPILWLLSGKITGIVKIIFSTGLFMVGFFSFHYLRIIPGSESIDTFMRSGVYLNLLSLLWYLTIGILAYHLTAVSKINPTRTILHA